MDGTYGYYPPDYGDDIKRLNERLSIIEDKLGIEWPKPKDPQQLEDMIHALADNYLKELMERTKDDDENLL